MRLTTFVRRHSVQLASAFAVAALVAAPTTVVAQTFTGGTVTAISANITPIGIAVAPPDQTTAFDTSVFASVTTNDGGLSPTGRDSVVRVMPDGSGVVEFQALDPGTFDWNFGGFGAGALAFAPTGSGFPQGLYLGSTSTVDYISPTGGATVFSSFNPMYTYTALAFVKPGTASTGLYATSSQGIDRLEADGSFSPVLQLNPADQARGLAFDEQNALATPNGGALYFTTLTQPTPGNYAVAINRLLQTGNPSQPFETTATQVAVTPAAIEPTLRGTALRFARGGAFGTGLYVGTRSDEGDVLVNDNIYVLTSAGLTLVGTGFYQTNDGGFEFSYDGTTMYVASSMVWKITGGVVPPPTTCGDDDKDRDKDREKADADEAKADREANDAKNAASKSAETAKSKARTKAQKNAIDADLKAKIAQIDADAAKKKADIEADFAKKHPKGKKKHCGGDDDDDDDDHDGDHDGKGEKGGLF